MSGADSGLARNSAIMAAGSLTSRILGMVRNSMLFALFAFSMPGQAFSVAQALPNMINLLLAGGMLNAVLVPQLTKAAAREDGREFADRLLTLTLLLIAGVTLICLPLSPLLVRLYAATFDDSTFSLAVSLTLLCLPAVFFYGLYTMLGQVLIARSRYGAFSWAPALCNVVWIVGIAVFLFTIGIGPARRTPWTPGMVALLGGTLTLGVAVQALILVVPLWRDGFRFRPRWGFKGAGLGSAGRVAGWTFAAVALSQLSFLVISQVLTAVDEHDPNLTGYQNAFLLFMTPHGLVTVSLVTALFTRMSVSAHRADLAAVRRDVSQGLRIVAVTMIPVTVATFALAVPGTRVLFAGNNAAETGSLAQMTTAMMIGVAPLGVLYLVQRAFFAFEDAKTPFWLGAISSGVVVVGALLCTLLPSPDRGFGVALTQGLSNVAAAAVGLVWLGRKLQGFSLALAIRSSVRALVASLPAGFLAWIVAGLAGLFVSGRVGAFIGLLIGAPVFVIGYVAIGRRLRMRELTQVLRRLPHPIRRLLMFF